MFKSLTKSILLGISVITAFVAGLFCCHWESINIIPQITFGQIIQSAMIFLVFLMANHYSTKVHDRRRKRVDIFVSLAGKILISVENLHRVFSDNAGRKIANRERIRLYSALREHSNSVNNLENIINELMQIREVRDSLNQVKNDRERYKDLITNDPYPMRLPEERMVGESKFFSQTISNLLHLQLVLSEFG